MSLMDKEALRQALLTLHRDARSELETFISTLSEAQRQAVGTSEHWSAKDLIVHITAWWRIQGQRIAEVAQGKHPETFAWSDEMNATIFASNAHLSWETVSQEMAQVSTAWQAAVESLDLDDFALPGRIAIRQGSPLWHLVLGNGYFHPLDHLTEHYLERGDLASATRLQERLTARLIAALPDEAGKAHYYLAGFYAKTTQNASALAELQKAFLAEPDLRTQARQETDLASLHTLPAFQELLG